LRLLRDALGGERRALRAFVATMSPVIQARVARAMLRTRRRDDSPRDIRQEVEDVTQEVFGALFADDGRVLRTWEPARGLSLANFVGLVADRHVASILRSGRRNPFREVPEEIDMIEPHTEPDPGFEPQLESRRTLERLLDRMRASLSTRGLELFQRLYVEEEPVDAVASAMGMTREAIYAWRNRVSKHVQAFARELHDDDDGAQSGPAERSSRGGTDG
jgi:RNA polymerase sigma-70 factor (ECF subfamily)